MAVTKSTIQTRKGLISDAEAIVRLGRHVFTVSFGHSVEPHELQAYLDSAYSIDAITKDLQDPNKDTIVATTTSGDLVGFALLTRGSEEPCVAHLDATVELQRIYVDDKLHGSGIGGKLSRAIDALAREQGFKNIWLGVWEENHGPKKAYEKWGYRKVGTHDFTVGSVVQKDDILAKSLEVAA